VKGNHQNNGKVFVNQVKSQEEAILANIKSNRSRPTFLNFINCASLRASFLASVDEIKKKIPSGYKRKGKGDWVRDKNRLKRKINKAEIKAQKNVLDQLTSLAESLEGPSNLKRARKSPS
jgi:hypothetical protein